MRKKFRQQIGVGGALAGVLLVLMASTAAAQTATGHWNFDDPGNPYAATVGADGYVWVGELPEPNSQSGDVVFDTASNLGIPLMPDGDGGVMSFPAFNPQNGFAVWHGMPANGGGDYVNQYTIIYDLLIPADQYGQWMSLWQTANCNTNDGDFYVRYDGAIGTWGYYRGQLLADTWHRVVAAVDLAAADPNAAIVKYIDGVLVGSQPASGLDGTHSLYTVDHGVPTLLIADENGDTAGGYLNAFQIRDYAMTDVEVAALGGVSNAGIPVGAGVAGSWDFDDPANGLAATVGNDLEFWNPFSFGCLVCDQDLTVTTEFGPASDWGLPDLQDGAANVMRFDAPIPCTGYMFPHGAEANGGGIRVNDYTIIVDVYYTAEDFFFPPEGHDPDWTPIYQADEENAQDALLWIYIPTGELGDDGSYEGTFWWCLEDTWMRIVAAVHGSHPTGTKISKYVLYADDTVVGPVTQDEGPGGEWEDQSGLSEFDTCSSFGIPLMPDGDGGVVHFPAFNPANAYAVWHGLSGNGGGYYVNEYTIIYDLLIPSDQYGQWMSLWQTNYCSINDGDFDVDPSGGIGTDGDYEGVILPDTWHRVVFAVDSPGPPSRVYKYIDGVPVGWTMLDGFEGRWTLYPVEDGVPTLLLADDDEETASGYLNSFQIRDYTMSDAEVAALGGVSNAGIPVGAGVAGSWDFDNPADGLAATVGNDLEFFNRYTSGLCGGEGIDDKRALRTAAEVGEDVLLMFSNDYWDPVYTHRGFCSSIQVRDYVMTEEEVLALGGPRASGIPIPPTLCPGDVDGDGDTDLSDLAALLAAYGTSVGDPNYNPNADFDEDGDVDLSDLAFLLSDYGC